MEEPRSFDRIAERYDETRGGEPRGRHFAEEIHRWMAPGLTLEVGIGTGVVAKGLQELGRPVVGIDISPLMLRRAVERLGPRVAVADARILPIGEESIDGAYSIWVLHLVDGYAVMPEVARTLRSGGRFVVSPSVSPEPDPITTTMRPMFDTLRGDKPRLDDPDLIIDMAASADLRVVVHENAAPQRFSESPEASAKLLEARLGFGLLDLDDATWQTVVVPTIEALRSLPDPEVEVERHTIPPILVFER